MPSSRCVAPRQWLAWVCLLWLSCTPSGSQDSRARAPEGPATVVGRRQESRVLAVEGPHVPSDRASAEERARAAEMRTRAAEAWRRTSGNDSALGLARAYFPEFAEEMQEKARKAPVNPEAALRVKLPATEGGTLEIATRGSVFRVHQQGGATPASKQGKSATFYGARHFWTAVGGQGVEEGLWLTQRAEEYVVTEGGGQPFRATYEVTVPEGVQAVRDAGDYLEFLDGQQVPVLRLHHAVARDSAGLSRQGEVKVWGLAAESSRGEAPLPQLALKGRTLRVEMKVGLEGMEGPVVVDPGWSSTGSMAVPREEHTATLLGSGKVLVVGGFNSYTGSYLASAEVYDPATGTWVVAGSLATARFNHAATLLSSGKVLVTGGANPSGYLASAEVYDPATGTWAVTGSMISARDVHTATLLPDGKVLVTGGASGNFILASAELYDPATGAWGATGSLIGARAWHTATLLASGKVLVTGGQNTSTVFASAQVYDPATGTWAATGFMAGPHEGHTATLLPSGKVLVAGGFGTSYATTVELYDPATGTWAVTGSLAAGRTGHTATLLPSGKVLVAGGQRDGQSLASVELYDPLTGTWAPTNSLAAARAQYTATLLPTGKVLVAGGRTVNSLVGAEVYDPGAGTWAYTGSMVMIHSEHTATLLGNGKVLVAAGRSGSSPHSAADLYSPEAGTWELTGNMRAPCFYHTATLLPSGKVLVVGGDNGSTVQASAQVYDPSGTGTWALTGSMATVRELHTATLLPNGKVLVVGGYNGSTHLASAELYDPGTGTWTPTGSMATPRQDHTATLLPNGKVLVAGGFNWSSFNLSSAELYDPATGTWAPTGSMTTIRADHTATLLPSGKVLVAAGGGAAGVYLASAELYDPATGTWASTGSLATGRVTHTATLLPSGKVLVVGGYNDKSSTYTLASVEMYDPATGTWTAMPSLPMTRDRHTATMLPNGRVLIAGGGGYNQGSYNSAMLYEDTGALNDWRPIVQTSVLRPGATVNVTGSGFRGVSEASGGNTPSSASNVPVLSLSAAEGGALTRMPTGNFSAFSVTTSVPGVPAGYYVLTVTTNGIPGGRVVFVSGTPLAPVVVTPASGAAANTATPIISGTAEAGSTVTVFLDGTPVGTTVVNGSGAWSFTPGTALAEGPHGVTAQATDTAGNTSPMSAVRSFTVDTVAPAAPVVVTPASGALVNTARPVISGTSEAGSTVVVSVDGTVVGTVVANGSGAWSFTPGTALTQGPHTVTAQATDAAGNVGPSSSALSFTVDSVAPGAPVVVTPASGALITTTKPVISGTAEAGSTVSVFVDGTVAGTVVADGSAAWTLTPSPALTEGPHVVMAQASDAAGNISPFSNAPSFTVDTVAPSAPVVVMPACGSLVNTRSPTVSGTAEAGSAVTVFYDGVAAGGVGADGSGNWSVTPAVTLAQGLHSVTTRAKDAAGNIGPVSSACSVTVDSVPPGRPSIVSPASGAFVNTSRPLISGLAEASSTVTVSVDGTVTGTVVASGSGSWSLVVSTALSQGAHTATARATDVAGNISAVSNARSFTVDTVPPMAPVVVTPASGALVNTATPVISGTAEANSTVTILVDGTARGTTVASGAGAWSFTPSAPLAEGPHLVTAQATDAASNTGPVSNARAFSVDTVAPGAPVVLTPASGALVNTATPVISGTAEAHSTVTLSVDGTVVGTAPADGSGTWSFIPSTPLTEGAHTVTAQASDASGNISPVSSACSFTVDTVAPGTPVVLTPADSAFVRTTTPVISGTAEAGSTVTIFLNGTVVGARPVDDAGTWSFTPGAELSQGAHTVTAQATDAAGNTSPVSDARSFSVDTVAPGAPVVLTPASEAVVNTSAPVISGTAEAGGTVTIFVDGTVVGMELVDGSGSWSFTSSTALSEGPHSITAQATDEAGNTGSVSDARSFTVDTGSPSAPVVLMPANGAVVSTSTPVISGTAEASGTVVISLAGTVVGTVRADGSGAWSFTPSTSLTEGPHTVTVQSSDAAGNTSPISNTSFFTVDTVIPAAPVVATPASGTVTNNPREAVAGTAEANTTITLFIDGVSIGTTTASSAGAWSFTPERVLAEGTHTVTATATDSAGNASSASSPITWRVDTVAPGAPVVTSPADGAVVDTRRPTITGTAEVGSTVTVILDGAEVGVQAVSETGTWSFTPTEDLASVNHTLAARGTDAAGNTGPTSVPISFKVSKLTTAPIDESGCAAAPTSAAGWVLVVLGIAGLRRRRPEWHTGKAR